jgi:hypothetical protein
VSLAQTTVETPLGTLRVWATDGDHLGAATVHDHEKTAHPEWGVCVESVRIFGVDYFVRLDLHPRAQLEANDTRWSYGGDSDEVREAAWVADRNYDYLSRIEYKAGASYNANQPSFAAHKKLRNELIPFMSAWAESDDGKKLLHEAENDRFLEDITAIRSRVRWLRDDADRSEVVADLLAAGRHVDENVRSRAIHGER